MITAFGSIMISVAIFLGCVFAIILAIRSRKKNPFYDEKIKSVLSNPELLVKRLNENGPIFDSGNKIIISVKDGNIDLKEEKVPKVLTKKEKSCTGCGETINHEKDLILDNGHYFHRGCLKLSNKIIENNKKNSQCNSKVHEEKFQKSVNDQSQSEEKSRKPRHRNSDAKSSVA